MPTLTRASSTIALPFSPPFRCRCRTAALPVPRESATAPSVPLAAPATTQTPEWSSSATIPTRCSPVNDSRQVTPVATMRRPRPRPHLPLCLPAILWESRAKTTSWTRCSQMWKVLPRRQPTARESSSETTPTKCTRGKRPNAPCPRPRPRRPPLPRPLPWQHLSRFIHRPPPPSRRGEWFRPRPRPRPPGPFLTRPLRRIRACLKSEAAAAAAGGVRGHQ